MSKSKKPPFVVLAEDIATAINLEASPFPTPWSGLYRVAEPARGERQVLVEGDGQVLTFTSIDELRDRIVAWMRLQGNPDWLVLPRQAREVAEMWRAIAEPIPLDSIKAVSWADEPGYTWHRLPWRREAGPHPTWDGLLKRMSNAEAFRHFVGSLFVDESTLQNYVWIHSNGGDGKGAINRFLSRVFGPAYRSKQPPNERGDRFWVHGLIGARLVVFPDCNDHRFVSLGLFKSLTGGDPVDAEAKGKMGFTFLPKAKYIILSNDKPSISSERADMRRIIYCEMEPYGAEEDPAFEARLWAEGGAFLTDCLRLYHDNYPKHGPLKIDREAIESWVATVEEPFEVFFNQNFAVDADQYVSPHVLQEVLREHWPGRRSPQLEFLKWLERTHKVRKTEFIMGACRTKGYKGIRHLSRSNPKEGVRHLKAAPHPPPAPWEGD